MCPCFPNKLWKWSRRVSERKTYISRVRIFSNDISRPLSEIKKIIWHIKIGVYGITWTKILERIHYKSKWRSERGHINKIIRVPLKSSFRRTQNRFLILLTNKLYQSWDHFRIFYACIKYKNKMANCFICRRCNWKNVITSVKSKWVSDRNCLQSYFQ